MVCICLLYFTPASVMDIFMFSLMLLCIVKFKPPKTF